MPDATLITVQTEHAARRIVSPSRLIEKLGSLIPRHMQILSKLPNISSLTLQNADLTMLHVGHLLPLGASLQSLDLSYNTSIDDSCLPITAFLPFLNQINLDRTSITMKGLRTFASVALPLRRLPYTQLIVPQECREYLLQAKQSSFYAFRIEEPYLIIKVSLFI